MFDGDCRRKFDFLSEPVRPVQGWGLASPGSPRFASRIPELPLILMTAVATHLVMSFAQTLMHYKLGHHPMGGKFFRNLACSVPMKGLPS
jgi:hypothetical protein